MFRRRSTSGRHAGPLAGPEWSVDPGPASPASGPAASTSGPASASASAAASASASASASVGADGDQDQPWGPPPAGLDVSTAHPARIWNYWLGGRDFFPADRAAGDAMARQFPHFPDAARAERAFLVRAVRFLAGPARMRQFLDVGAGLPSGGNTHEIVQRIAPDSGAVYVDNDPAVILHAKALLEEAGFPEGVVGYLDADLRDVSAVLAGAAGTLDMAKPVALILLGVLGHIEDYGAARSIVSHLMDALPSGSYLVIGDGVAPGDGDGGSAASGGGGGGGGGVGNAASSGGGGGGALAYHLRRPDELVSFFDGLALVEPGVVPCSQWRPDAPGRSGEVAAYCGVARKPLRRISRLGALSRNESPLPLTITQ